MNRMFVCLFVSLVLLVVAIPLAAQEDVYLVQKGDNLWNLAGARLDDARLWEQIYKDNPFLQEPGRRFQKDGIVYVMVRPGEKLIGLEKLGIIAEFTPIDRLRLPQQTAIYEMPTTPAWVWWLLGLTIAVLVAAWLINQMLTRDPVNSRPAMIQGGVRNINLYQTGENLEIVAMQQVAARHAGNSRQQASFAGVYRQFTIIRQTTGRIWGVLNVLYADGHEVPRRLNGERAYEATVRFPDGHEETLYMLQGCGNDLRYGGISRYLPGPEFRFEADPTPVAVPVQPAPQPVTEPEPTAQAAPSQEGPASATPTASAEISAPALPQDRLTFEMKRSSDGKPHLVRFDSGQVEEFFIGRDGRITVRYRESE